MQDITHAYKATGKCGKLVGAVADMLEYPKETAKHVSEFIKDGFTIIRVESEHVRQAEWCDNHAKCKNCKANPELKNGS